jgi:GNAT superfamily N-acetyltransferase
VTAVVVEATDSAKSERAFIDLPYRLHARDPMWVAPLRSAEVARWDPSANPALQRMKVRRFVARSDRRVIGRVAAMVDPLFAERWEPGAGFFGFLDYEDGRAVAEALMKAAEDQLVDWGCRSAIGPIAGTTHDEVGLLVEGFGRRPVVLQPYQPEDYVEAVEAAGYAPHREYGSFEWRPDMRLDAAIARLDRMVRRRGEDLYSVRIRALDPKRFVDDVRLIHELYNESFDELWGFTPISWGEFRAKAEEFRPFYRPDLILIGEQGGEPVAFAIVLPDVNQALAKLGGRLLPFGWLRLFRDLRRLQAGRFLLIGVRPGYEGRGIAPLLVLRMRSACIGAGMKSVDASLVQLDNRRMLRVVEALGCEPTRVFRLYRKEL